MGSRILQFYGVRDLLPQMQKLYQLGGAYKRAADHLMTLSRKVKDGDGADADEIFSGFRVTKHGESRIEHCVKYDLTGFVRLVTVQHKGLCVICFAGTHDDADAWLDRNVGYTPVVRKESNGGLVEVVYNSPNISVRGERVSNQTDLAVGFLYERIPGRYFDRLTGEVNPQLIASIKQWTTITTEDEMCVISCEIQNSVQATAIFDTFVSLRGGDVIAAKHRIDQYSGDLTPIGLLDSAEIKNVRPGEDFVDLSALDPELFAHYIKTADYRSWMMYLHPDQRVVVDRDFNGPARLSGVSGSGKTAVIIKRALRLAEKYSLEPILVLTLNRSLAQLIRELVAASAPESVRSNITVCSFWEFCRDKLFEFEPDKKRHYDDVTYKANDYGNPEHVDEIWDEYYYQENNNKDAEALFPVHKSMVARGVYPFDYLRQELDFVRSAMPSWQRKRYLDVERLGRCIPLDKTYREFILKGLAGWEKKMEVVGVIDYLGLATALYRHRDKLKLDYRCVLVDEAQDFGVIELDLIRRLVRPEENDLFFAGDIAQQVYTKLHDYAQAGVNIIGRSMAIKRNYRNSREILAAAFDVLNRNLSLNVRSQGKLDILDPEFANFSTPKPLLLRGDSVANEFSACLNYYREILENASYQSPKLCIAVCGYSLRDLESVGQELGLPVLAGSTSLTSGSIFLSDLEQTKGFEFDSICILNCNKNILPSLGIPADEQYRDLSKFYVAMTRAKSELIISFSSDKSLFLNGSENNFVEGSWGDYAQVLELEGYKFPLVPKRTFRDSSSLGKTGKEFLYSRMALGLSQEIQDKLIERVQGRSRMESLGNKRKRTIGWRSVEELLRHPTTDDLKQLFGVESWQKIVQHFSPYIK